MDEVQHAVMQVRPVSAATALTVHLHGTYISCSDSLQLHVDMM